MLNALIDANRGKQFFFFFSPRDMDTAEILRKKNKNCVLLFGCLAVIRHSLPQRHGHGFRG